MGEKEGEKLVDHRYELEESESPSHGVYTTVATLEDCSPLDLPPLAESADTDALDALLAGGGEECLVSFEYCGYDVTARPDEVHVHRSHNA